MRLNLAIFVIMMTWIQVSASDLHAQNVSINVKDAPLRTVFESLRKQTGYQFFFDNEVLKKAANVTLQLKGVSLNQALDQLFSKQPLSYEIVEKTIVVTEKTVQPNSHSKQQVITGKVTNQSGQPLSGVTVSVKGTSRMTATDNQGNFTIEAGSGQVLVFAYVGYVTQEKEVGGGIKIDVVLAESISQLDLIKIQGYGTTTQRLATGNIATVSAETIGQQPVTNVLQAISGRIAGVRVTQSSGIPGSAIAIQIRGRNSINTLNNSPLYIVDGVPFIADDISVGGQLTSISPLNSISPNNIESINILKDADATSIYGSRAANGVIVITTKSGAVGKSKFSVNLNRAFSHVASQAKVMSTEQYLQLRRDAFANSAITPTLSNAPDLINWDPKVDNDMLDWFMGNTADVWDAGTSLSGGNPNTQFLLSGNFHRESTMFSDNDRFDRGNMLFSLSHASDNRKLKIKFNGIFGVDNNKVQNHAAGGPSAMAFFPPNYPLFDMNGNYNWEGSILNYYALANAYSKANNNNLNLSLNISNKLSKQFELVANVGYGRIGNESAYVSPAISKNPASSSPLGNTVFRSNGTTTYLFEPQVKYFERIANGDLTALVGATVQKRNSTSDIESVGNYLTDLLLESKGAGTVSGISSTNSEYNFLSFFGRVSYNWKNRYILNTTFRRDGSSRFGPSKRFGNFGSVGAAWLFSNENFFKDRFSWISYGKVRGSFGTTGSDGIRDYGYLSLYSFTSDYGTQKAIVPSQILNDNYQWESTKKLEFALELGFIQDQILFKTAYYRNRSSNQLIQFPLPTTTGFAGYIANLPALVQNNGLEFEINTQNIKKRSFTWSSDFNVTIPQNKLLEFDNIEQTSFANTLVLGKPLNSYLGYQFTGIDQNTGVSSIADLSGNGVISGNSIYNGRGGDKYYVGTTDPQWFAALTNTLSYKGFNLEISFQYNKQSGYNLFYALNGFSSFGTMQNAFVSQLGYWKQPGDQSQIPKPFAASNTEIRRYAESDKAFSDASFLRLKNASLSYSIPTKWINKIGLSNANLILLGQNLFTITNYNGQDPEQAGFVNIRLSTLRTISFGIKTTF